MMMMSAEDFRQILVMLVVVVVMIASAVASVVAVEVLQLLLDDELLGKTNCSLNLRQQKEDLALVWWQKAKLV